MFQKTVFREKKKIVSSRVHVFNEEPLIGFEFSLFIFIILYEMPVGSFTVLILNAVREVQRGSKRVREVQIGLERVREGQRGSERVREGQRGSEG